MYVTVMHLDGKKLHYNYITNVYILAIRIFTGVINNVWFISDSSLRQIKSNVITYITW